jgi:hypothetical protein
MLPTTFMIAQSNPPSISDNGGILGHVTYVVRGPDGHIKEYAQTDNMRTVQGINCAEQIMFNGLSTGSINTNGTNACGFQGSPSITSAKFNGFRFIGLINGTGTYTAANLNGSDTYAQSKVAGTRASSADGIIPVGLTNRGSPLNSTVAGVTTCSGNPCNTPGTYNGVTITSPAFTFSGMGTTSTIRGSVLLNATSGTPAMFAENFLSPTVTVGPADTLTVTWNIQLS